MLKIDRIGLGTWGLGGVYYGKMTFEQGVEVVRAYIDGGGRHIDTAYSYHQAEEVIGKAIKPYNREDLFITGKTYAGCFDTADIPRVREECEISLRDLDTDYLDNYMIHGTPFEADHFNRIADEFDTLKQEGKIRSIGCSIRGPVVTDETRDSAIMAIQSGRVEAVQLNYSIARQKHGEVFNLAMEKDVALIARWVLESGMLTSVFDVGHEFVWPDTRNRYLPEERDTILQIGQDLKDILPEGYNHPAQVAIGFALAEPAITGIVLGSYTVDEVHRNLKLRDLPPLPSTLVQTLKDRYGSLNDRCNPSGEFEHVPSPRRPLGDG